MAQDNIVYGTVQTDEELGRVRGARPYLPMDTAVGGRRAGELNRPPCRATDLPLALP